MAQTKVKNGQGVLVDAALVTNTGQASAENSLPVVLPAAQIAALTPPTNVSVTGTFWQTTQPVSLAGSVGVTGTFWQTTQPVSFTWAGLTDTQLRAAAVAVSVTALPLPTGAATEAKQDAIVAKLSTDPATQTTAAATLAKLNAGLSVGFTPATSTSRSGTITAGGAAQALAAANSSRKGWALQNNSTADLWVNEFGGTASAAQPSLKIAAGNYYESPPGGGGTLALSVFGATAGQAFTAKEW